MREVGRQRSPRISSVPRRAAVPEGCLATPSGQVGQRHTSLGAQAFEPGADPGAGAAAIAGAWSNARPIRSAPGTGNHGCRNGGGRGPRSRERCSRPPVVQLPGGTQRLYLPLTLVAGTAAARAATAVAGRVGMDEVSNAYVINAVAIASAFTSSARRLMFPISGYT